ncbi:MAG: hypothetical protein WC429_13395 [Verrucomicrobiia bacterium]
MTPTLRTLLLLAMACAMAGCARLGKAGAAKSGSTRSNDSEHGVQVCINVQIEQIRMTSDEPALEFDLLLTSQHPKTLLVSSFCLGGIVKNAKFREVGGGRLKVHALRVFADAPPIDVDYCIILKPNEATRTTVSTPTFLNAHPEKRRPSDAIRMECQVAYDIASKNLSVFEKETDIHRWVECKGRGITRMKWPRSEQAKP